ncbi:MAG: TlpA family protein disulfide reductase [Anaerolineae bacterium]|nr:TlpA family protein disulfide reductase [Anaerolineae bacterium]
MLGPGAEPIIAPVVGGRVPPIQATTLDGEALRVPLDRPQPLILNFWATWCVPCLEEMPLLETLYRAGVPIVGINAGLEAPAEVAAWLLEQRISFPILVDDANRTLEGRFRVRGLPATFFIDEQGIIQHIVSGALTPQALERGLDAIGLVSESEREP